MQSSLPLAREGRRRSALIERILYRPRIDPSPLMLEHHRVFVLPTRRGWAFLLALLLMLVTSMNYALSLGYGLTFLVAGLIGSSLIHVARNLVNLQIEPSGSPRAFAGEPLSFSFRLTNLARHPRRWVRLWSGQSEGVVATLHPGGSAIVAVAVATRSRGRLGLGRFTTISDYPLGLWRAWSVVRFHYEGIVYPAPEVSPPPLPAGGDEAMAPAARLLTRLSDDHELDGLREYVAGDSLHAIAWKAVARGGGWYTKRMSGAAGQQWAVLRWIDTAAAGDDERRLSRLAGWALHAERNGIAFALELPGHSVGMGQGAAHLDEALCALGEFGGKRAQQ